MTTKELDKKLNAIIDEFTSEIRSRYPEGKRTSIDSDDLNELARQTSYALSYFKDEIISYLNHK